jgi:23S rRNA (adenine2030-N6)-methyltransferase
MGGAMNYRHQFHAGNQADCVKHALFVALLRGLQRKAKPLMVLDTHAGLGAYDLRSPASQRTLEAQSGIVRLRAAAPPALADYLDLADAAGWYRGSPALAHALLRPEDRLVLCELHPEDGAALRQRFRADPRVHVHIRDGYQALKALLPPPERRALVLIDPPFEQSDEFATLATALARAQARFPAGVYAAWYPLKSRAPVRDFHGALQAMGVTDVIDCMLAWRNATDPSRLNGCGLVVVNPPYRFADEAETILGALLGVFAEEGGFGSVTRVTDE